jgi:hypothetical protein
VTRPSLDAPNAARLKLAGNPTIPLSANKACRPLPVSPTTEKPEHVTIQQTVLQQRGCPTSLSPLAGVLQTLREQETAVLPL